MSTGDASLKGDEMNKEISYGSWEELNHLLFGIPPEDFEYYKRLDDEFKQYDPDGSKAMNCPINAGKPGNMSEPSR